MIVREKTYLVASVSENTNSFGLRGMVLVADNGEAWEVAANDLNLKAKGDRVTTPVDRQGFPTFVGLGFEIPRQLGNAPQIVVDEIWGLQSAKS